MSELDDVWEKIERHLADDGVEQAKIVICREYAQKVYDATGLVPTGVSDFGIEYYHNTGFACKEWIISPNGGYAIYYLDCMRPDDREWLADTITQWSADLSSDGLDHPW